MAKTQRAVDAEYTEDKGQAICEGLMAPLSLRKVCDALDIPRTLVYRWLARGELGEEPHKTFLGAYNAARVIQAEAHAEEMVDIADEADQTTEAVAHAKLRISTRQWNAEKLRPKKYGTKVEVEGEIGLKVEIVDFGDGQGS